MTHSPNNDALAFDIEAGAIRCVQFGGVEVLRMIDCPIRDAEWRTLAVEEVELNKGSNGLCRRFRTRDGALRGTFELWASEEGDAARLEARLELVVERDVDVNRAGLVLLHPILGVAGTSLGVVHSDGSIEGAAFPRLISPCQPASDIVGLRHRVEPVAVEIAMEGEIFEMEDQRNWTDASYKTYCRPLAQPRPYRLTAGETVRQRIVVTLTRGALATSAAAASAATATAPGIALAHEPAIGGQPPEAVAALEIDGVLLRVDAADPTIDIGQLRAPVTLEIVVDADIEGDLSRVKAACAAAGLSPTRVVVLPRPYLESHQPDGPWPHGPTPVDAVAPARAAFPEAEVGGGMLTNFTEFNRCRPDPEAIDFATFGSAAIVHAADDRSVLETLEALGDVFASARMLVDDRPLRLGLVSIGMRSNPYGAAVASNRDRARVPMAMDDPRQRESFAAAFAVGVAAAAARGGVAGLAPAMAAGPLGLGADGELWPLYHAVAALAALGEAEVKVVGGPAKGVVSILGRGKRGVRGVAANLGPEAIEVTAPDGARVLACDGADAVLDPGWLDRPGSARRAWLGRFDVIVFKESAA